MKRSLLLTIDFPPIIGGIATVYYNMWKYFPQDRMLVLTPHAPGDREFDRDALVRPVRYSPAGKGTVSKITGMVFMFFLTLYFILFRGVREIHAGQLLSCGPTGYFIQRLFGIPCYLWLYGGESGSNYIGSPRKKKFAAYLLARCTYLITNSPTTTREFIDYGISRDRIIEIIPAVDSEMFCPGPQPERLLMRYRLEGKKIIATIGRLVERKGLDLVLRAMVILKDYSDLHYVIVGGGPAGIFAALELCQTADIKILLLEKGKDIEDRLCPLQKTGDRCISCSPCHLVSGLGGAGAFSDGKLTLSHQVGGRLSEKLNDKQAQKLIDYVDSIYLNFGAPEHIYGIDESVENLRRRATLADLRLIPVKLRHMGTERSRQVLKAMRDFIEPRIEMRLGVAATRILIDDNAVSGVETSQGEKLKCRYLILAPGREGADWLTTEASRLMLTLKSNPVDVGIRVELPNPVLEELTSVLYEAKLEFFSKSFDNRVRTFCMCPGGEVIMESTGGSDPVITVNGNSYLECKTSNTNFAILVSTNFTEPFHEPIAYGKYLARLANLISGGVLIQRLGDLMEGHRSTPERIQRSIVEPTLKAATPGDLSFVLPFRHLKSIVEMLQAMDKLAPGVASRHTLLYGVEIKFYSSQLQLNRHLETEISNMFAAGDGAGVSRGLIQASACGVVIAREILSRLSKQPTTVN